MDVNVDELVEKIVTLLKFTFDGQVGRNNEPWWVGGGGANDWKLYFIFVHGFQWEI